MQQRNNSTSSPSASEPKHSAANSATTTINEIKLSHVAIAICLVVAAGVSSFSIVVNIHRYAQKSTPRTNPTQLIHNHSSSGRR